MSNTENKQVKIVAAIKDGTVIDRIPSDKLFKVASILHIEDLSDQVTVGNNLESHELGTKGIIKVSDKFFNSKDINKIALIAPNAKLNVIKDYLVVEKKTLSLPDTLEDIVKCGNPNCITNHEPMVTRFHVEDNKTLTLRCHYCERVMSGDDIRIL
jgi:aspartate carbamoyltransferase, regulatory subunit